MRLTRCPHCKGLLNPGGSIALLGAPVEDEVFLEIDLNGDPPDVIQNPDYVMFSFSPDPGDYQYSVAEDVEIKKGDRWMFACPLCRKDLTSQFSNDLANFISIDEEGNEHVLVFSKLAGEHATFDVSPEGIEGFGEHHHKYVVISIQRHYW